MKPRQLFFVLLTLTGVGCSPTPKAERQPRMTDVLDETNSTNTFVWPDSVTHLPANPQECYYDKVLEAYAADTAFYAYEETCLESRYFFVASRIQPMKLPKEWKSNRQLCDMVAFYNFMEILHAIEADYDAYQRYTNDPADYDEEELKAQKEFYDEIRKDFFAELDQISLKPISDKRLQEFVKIFIEKLKELASIEDDEQLDNENIWDISSPINQLTGDWLPDIFADSVRYLDWVEQSSPQHYLPDWASDVSECYFGQFSKPNFKDKMEILNCFNDAENFNEKLAWGFTVIGARRFEPMEEELRGVEGLLASGKYSPLLDLLWRAYRVKYNDTYSCPSSWCYSPNLRYNHFRRIVAYTTLRHIEAYPDDELARVQYYFMVMHTNILRVNHDYPYGNSIALEVIMLYWNQMLLYY